MLCNSDSAEGWSTQPTAICSCLKWGWGLLKWSQGTDDPNLVLCHFVENLILAYLCGWVASFVQRDDKRCYNVWGFFLALCFLIGCRSNILLFVWLWLRAQYVHFWQADIYHVQTNALRTCFKSLCDLSQYLVQVLSQYSTFSSFFVLPPPPFYSFFYSQNSKNVCNSTEPVAYN